MHGRYLQFLLTERVRAEINWFTFSVYRLRIDENTMRFDSFFLFACLAGLVQNAPGKRTMTCFLICVLYFKITDILIIFHRLYFTDDCRFKSGNYKGKKTRANKSFERMHLALLLVTVFICDYRKTTQISTVAQQ